MCILISMLTSLLTGGQKPSDHELHKQNKCIRGRGTDDGNGGIGLRKNYSPLDTKKRKEKLRGSQTKFSGKEFGLAHKVIHMVNVCAGPQSINKSEFSWLGAIPTNQMAK